MQLLGAIHHDKTKVDVLSVREEWIHPLSAYLLRTRIMMSLVCIYKTLGGIDDVFEFCLSSVRIGLNVSSCG